MLLVVLPLTNMGQDTCDLSSDHYPVRPAATSGPARRSDGFPIEVRPWVGQSDCPSVFGQGLIFCAQVKLSDLVEISGLQK